jgi:16S rRNA (guanine(966)-N(2))-methyltransferase RsmD
MGGSARGRKLKGPAGLNFRPTTGRVKEFIFSYLGRDVETARILDLFSGTGSLGIEAISRGANESIFVEQSLQCIKILSRNLEICNFKEKSKIIKGDVFSQLRKMGRSGEMFDYIMADPPFKKFLKTCIVKTVEKNQLLGSNGLLIIEHEFHDNDLSDSILELIKQRRFGNCVISIYK